MSSTTSSPGRRAYRHDRSAAKARRRTPCRPAFPHRLGLIASDLLADYGDRLLYATMEQPVGEEPGYWQGHHPALGEPVCSASKWAVSCFVQTTCRQIKKHGIRIGSVPRTSFRQCGRLPAHVPRYETGGFCYRR